MKRRLIVLAQDWSNSYRSTQTTEYEQVKHTIICGYTVVIYMCDDVVLCLRDFSFYDDL